MRPMNHLRNDPAVNQLVAAYEAQFGRGEEVFFEEKAYLKIIDFYEKDFQLDKALEVAGYAITHHTYSSECYSRKAELLIGLGKAEEALSVLEEARLFAPSEPDIDLLQAEALIVLQRPAEAHAILEEMKLEADSELLSDILLVEALVYEAEGQQERMFFTLKAAIEADLSNQEALERFGACIDLSRKYEESILFHEGLLEQDAYLAQAWYNLGQAHNYLGNYEEAIQAYEYAYLADENMEEAFRECAGLCFELRQYYKALGCYEELLENFETDSDLYISIGQCYFHLKKYKSALAFYTRALQFDPLNDELYFYMGECYAMEEEWITAIHFFEKAIQIEEGREDYHAALGHAYYYFDEWDKADACYRQAVTINPDDSQYWVKWAVFLLDTGRATEALNVLEEGDIDDDSAELMYCRTACLFAAGKRQEACYWLGEALLENFDGHRLLFTILPDLEQDPDVLSLISTYSLE